MKTIPLTQGKVAIVDDEDYAKLSLFRWCIAAKKYPARTIVMRGGKKVGLYMHRAIMRPPSGLDVDHINGDTFDNRRCNLRICTRAQNLWNTGCRRTNRLGVKGVFQNRKSFRASIDIPADGKKTISLGSFKTIAEASAAYNAAALKYHGEFARISPLPRQEVAP